MEKALRQIIDAHYGKYVAKIIYRLRRVSMRERAGDDTPMRTLWDHLKWEMQEQHSLFHEMIEEMVEREAQWLVEKMPHETGALMTLVTEEFEELDEEEAKKEGFFPDAVARELINRVGDVAINEPHRREVQRLLDN